MSMMDRGDFGLPANPPQVKLDLRTADDAIDGEYWIAPFGGVYRRKSNGWVGVPTGTHWLDSAGLVLDGWVKANASEVITFERAEKRS